MNQIMIFTGKGGVGKSSIAAAHALQSAEEGCRTILVSADMAHNLGDILNIRAGKEIVEVNDCLDVCEMDPEHIMQTDFPDLIECFLRILQDTGTTGHSEVRMFPGMEELFSLLKIAQLYESGKYGRIIVDCAPTGETLALLKFPELLSWYMEKLFPIGKFAIPILAPLSKHFFSVELPGKDAMSDIEMLYGKLFSLQQLLKNREITAIRLVAIPEKMVVEETRRNYRYLNLYNFNVDGLYINRILPDDLDNPFFADWLTIQHKYTVQLEESFSQLPIYHIPWYDEEIRGSKAVTRICRDVLDGRDVFALREITQREIYEKKENGYLLRITVPFADKSELELFETGRDCVLRLGSYKRNIPLPDVLRGCKIASAKLENSELKIQFEREASNE